MSSSPTGVNVLLDTNIIIYYFNQEPGVTHIVEDNFLHTSIITEIEVLGYEIGKDKLLLFHEFFEDITIHHISSRVKEKAINYKRNMVWKLLIVS